MSEDHYPVHLTEEGLAGDEDILSGDSKIVISIMKVGTALGLPQLTPCSHSPALVMRGNQEALLFLPDTPTFPHGKIFVGYLSSEENNSSTDKMIGEIVYSSFEELKEKIGDWFQECQSKNPIERIVQ